MIGIQAGASSRTHVTRPGAASKRRPPNWRSACSQTGAGGWASITAISRLSLGNRHQAAPLVFDMNKIQHFDSPTFEADVLQAAEPVVVDFWAEWCPPCKMMEPAVEALAEELAGKVKIGKLDVDADPEIAIQYNVMGIPTLALFREGKLVDRMVGYPRGAAPIRAWLEKSTEATTANK